MTCCPSRSRRSFQATGCIRRRLPARSCRRAIAPGRPPTRTSLQVLDSLVEQSLLLRRADSDGETRFWMLETIREYAYERLESAGELDTLCGLHADWFTALAEELDLKSRTGDQSASVARLGCGLREPAGRRSIGRAKLSRASCCCGSQPRSGPLVDRVVTWPRGERRSRTRSNSRAAPGRRCSRARGAALSASYSGSSRRAARRRPRGPCAQHKSGRPLTLAQAWNLPAASRGR
jgi:hypothetical protein